METILVQKRNGTTENFNGQKIYNAIMKAMKYGSGIVKEDIATEITHEMTNELTNSEKRIITIINDIEPMVFDKLCNKGETITARMYEAYRAKRELQRQENELDDVEAGIVDGYNKDEREENSNKNPDIAATQRDLMAGLYSRSYSRRKKLPVNITAAHDEGQIHFHDTDYFMQHIHNCFNGNTEFVTDLGVIKFKDCTDGQIVKVKDLKGNWRTATVHKYGQQKMQKVTLKSCRTTKEIKCTRNHRWVLSDGTITTDLQVGDKLWLTNDSRSTTINNINAFCLGFVLGDGCDYIKSSSQGIQVRLCGAKIQYVDIFVSAGYRISSQQFDNGDILLTKPGRILKQNFIKNHCWNYMSKDDLIDLFNGFYAADGTINSNCLSTSDDDIAEMIREISSLAGYYISSEKFEIRDTQFKNDAKLYTFHFMPYQVPQHRWIVESIDRTDNHVYDAWCVEEPITHTFTLASGIVTGNCMLINLEDMLQNGTVINNKLIEKPKSFQTACTISTQIVQQVANGQYGGQTISLTHLAPFVRTSYEKIKANKIAEWEENEFIYTKSMLENAVMKELHKEIKAGVQTIQYQINTFSTSNGQAPFLSVFMYLNEDPEYTKEVAMIIEEMLKQRIQGIKNEQGVYVTPSFPKLLYVLDNNNTYEGSKYYYLTELAAECVAKRMVPDFISAKIMRQNYDGEVFPCMGCVEGNEIITYKFKNDLYVESFARMWDRLSKEFIIQHQYSIDNPNLYMDLTNVQIYDTVKGFVNTQRIIRNISNNWVKVHMTNGRILTCTDDHPFATNNGRVLAKDLVQGQTVTINHSQYIGNSHYNWEKDLSWAYGVMLCDGSIASTPNGTFAITGEDNIINKLKSTFDLFYNINCKVKEQHRGVKGEYKEISMPSRKLQYDLIKYFEGISKEDRHIPNILFSMSYLSRLSFLAGMIDADGYINSTSTLSKVQLGSTNKELALQQMALMQSLNMPAYIYENHYDKKHPEKIRYRVECIPSDDLVNSLQCDKKKQLFTNNIRKNSSMNESEVSEIDYIENISMNDYSYDVTTDSDHFEVSGIYSHNCRSFLSPWKDPKTGKYKWYGRFNQGVVTINLVDVGLSANKDKELFWSILDERLELCKQALMLRYENLKGTSTRVSPIHFRYGAIARLGKDETIDSLLLNGYSTISLGYAGLYECVVSMLGESHTTEKGEKFALEIMQFMRDKCELWKKQTTIAFGLYGTPLESTTYKFAKSLKARFGVIPEVTDHDYITNSYHVNVREKIDPFEKLKFESQFQSISSGGAISYIEMENMVGNEEAVIQVMQYIYENIQYAEMNGKFDYCHICGHTEMEIDDNNEWYCPNCGNRNQEKMNVARRTCGYIGDNFWNVGRTKEIKDRVTHLSNKVIE